MRIVTYLSKAFGAPSVHLTVFVLLCFSAPADGQIRLVRVTPCPDGPYPATACTIPASGAGNLLVVGYASAPGSAPTINSIVDNVGNSYAHAGNARAVDTAANSMVDIWFAKNSRSGATNLTITPSVSGTGAPLVWEFSGVNTVSPLEQTAILNTQPATTLASGAPVNTVAPQQVIISVLSPSGNVNGIHAGNVFISDSLNFGVGWAHVITQSAGTFAAQWDTSSGTNASSTVSFKAASTGGGPVNSCDLTSDGTVDSEDVDLAIKMTLGVVTPCTANIQASGQCDIVTVQRVVNASLPNGICLTGTSGVSHSVTLDWTASTSPNILGYNIYRATTSGGPYAKLNSSLVNAITYLDNTVQSGKTYYYVLTSVNSGSESVFSNQTQAIVPTP